MLHSGNSESIKGVKPKTCWNFPSKKLFYLAYEPTEDLLSLRHELDKITKDALKTIEEAEGGGVYDKK
jgi:hypothetical protein